MKALLLIVTSVMSGCAALATPPPLGDAEAQTRSMAAGRSAQGTNGGRTQTVGLPLSRAGKIGLWAGVAVFLAYLMASDGDDEEHVGAPAP
jgi:hypothetical protein